MHDTHITHLTRKTRDSRSTNVTRQARDNTNTAEGLYVFFLNLEQIRMGKTLFLASYSNLKINKHSAEGAADVTSGSVDLRSWKAWREGYRAHLKDPR